MSALAEALLAAQRQAVGSLSKAFVADKIDLDQFGKELIDIGCTDAVDIALLMQSLSIVRKYGGEAPKVTGQTNERKAPEQPTQAQKSFIAQLCRDRNVPEPDVIVSKEQASEIIETLKAGTYNADKYDVPF